MRAFYAGAAWLSAPEATFAGAPIHKFIKTSNPINGRAFKVILDDPSGI
jgi:hypothetical protein